MSSVKCIYAERRGVGSSLLDTWIIGLSRRIRRPIPPGNLEKHKGPGPETTPIRSSKKIQKKTVLPHASTKKNLHAKSLKQETGLPSISPPPPPLCLRSMGCHLHQEHQ
ncbi:hypothetical protein NPIL_566801 [Nephila pilipes]|uniref:Uncharacterized protein n=1 Tax=Nephila pilipes TaxID=299642 RepID=A0A8X6UF58_NEPPI|nr:hypothetical protein NPIL_566801 [Nephila pilipes]